jgi:hypothetical protein
MSRLLVVLALPFSLGVGPCGTTYLGSVDAGQAGVGAGPGDAALPFGAFGRCPSLAQCTALVDLYRQALLRAQRCTPSPAGTCQLQAPGSLRCTPACLVWVNDRTELDAVRTMFEQASCPNCLRETCPVCIPSGPPVCASGLGPATSSSGGAICMDSTVRQRVCPDGLTTGAPCALHVDYCKGAGDVTCFCTDTSSTWICQ